MLHFDVNHKTRVKISIDPNLLLEELDHNTWQDPEQVILDFFEKYYLEFKTANATRLTFEGPRLFTINHYHRSQSTSGL